MLLNHSDVELYLAAGYIANPCLQSSCTSRQCTDIQARTACMRCVVCCCKLVVDKWLRAKHWYPRTVTANVPEGVYAIAMLHAFG